MSSTNKSRRKFIKNSALASSLFIVPRHVLGGQGYTSPSDKLNLAGIGLHGKGQSDILHSSVGAREMLLHYVMYIKVHMAHNKLQKTFQMQNFILITEKCLIKKI